MALIIIRRMKRGSRQIIIKGLVIVLIAAAIASLGFFVKGKRTVPAFGGISNDLSSTSNSMGRKDFNNAALKQIIRWAIPFMEDYNNSRVKEDLLFRINTFVRRIPVLTTNIDVFSPESFFSFQIPLMNLAKAQSVSTPGVEYPLPEDFLKPEPVPEADEIPPEEPTAEKIYKMGEKPLILIVHTHTSESYMPSKEYDYKPRDKAYHTEDLNFSVAKVGQILAEELISLGVPTLQDKTIHDIPTYTTSYSNSLKTAESVLKKNPSVQIVIDLHRDAPVVSAEGSREITTVKIGDVLYSRLMFVVGTDKTFSHPDWKENYAFAQLLNNRLEQQYPGISRGIDLRSERFNQHVSKKALLIEVGSHGNTMEESLISAKVLAKVLAEVIDES